LNFLSANSERRAAKARVLLVRAAVCGLALFATARLRTPEATAQVPSPKDVVAPTAFASYDPVARGKEFQIAVVMKIRDGFHVNARKKSAEYLIATDLKTDGATGFKIGDVTYPDGQERTFTFSKTPLNVYEKTVVLKVPVTALHDAPTGPQHIPLKLKYQACNNEVCLPPVTLPVDATVNVTDSARAAHPAHPDIFQNSR
jgi:thiol:disulfide interchange protein DsbD